VNNFTTRIILKLPITFNVESLNSHEKVSSSWMADTNWDKALLLLPSAHDELARGLFMTQSSPQMLQACSLTTHPHNLAIEYEALQSEEYFGNSSNATFIMPQLWSISQLPFPENQEYFVLDMVPCHLTGIT
jgi:hypothetical protein